MEVELAHDTLGLGATGGGFFLGVWLVVIGDTFFSLSASPIVLHSH
jgi:hypothetical protein